MKTKMPLVLIPAVALTLSCSDTKRSKPPPSRAAPGTKRAPSPLSNILAHPAFAYAAKKGGAKAVSLSDIAERAVRGVVNISSTRRVRRPRGLSPYHDNPFFDYFRFHGMPMERRARSLGSGVIVSADGVVITNNHVVQEAEQIRVTLSDGRQLAAKTIGSDPKSDLAVLRLKGNLKKIEPLPIGDSNRLRLGEVVLAIGNPFGVGQTVTMGIVSALGRANIGIVDYEDFIQTDAAINPGNSGGALINMAGEVVGINTAILSRSGGYQGIGFAIPSVMARPIMESILKHGKVVRGWLGVVIQNLTEEIAQAMKVPSTQGILVADVQPGSPAAKAGLRRGDVITALDGKAMHTVTHLRNRVAAAGPEAKVTLKVLREGKEVKVAVKLGTLPGDQVARIDRSQGVLGGLTLENLTDEHRRRLGLAVGATGVLVKAVEDGSAADTAGLQAGDVILQINRLPVSNPFQFAAAYRRAKDKVLLLVHRLGSTLYVLLEK